jgi:hypothetical protein
VSDQGSGIIAIDEKRSLLLQHSSHNGCILKREGGSHSLWTNPANGVVEAMKIPLPGAARDARVAAHGASRGVRGSSGVRLLLPFWTTSALNPRGSHRRALRAVGRSAGRSQPAALRQSAVWGHCVPSG